MIHTSELVDFLPHRAEMIWIDHVVGPGKCQVITSKDKHYFSHGSVRQSTYIEWIAQSYGYSQAFEKKKDGGGDSMGSVFLVSVSNAKFSDELILDREEIFIEVSQSFDLGSVSVVEGKVYSKGKNIVYCEATLKLLSK